MRPTDPDLIAAEAASSLAAVLSGWRDKYRVCGSVMTSSTGIPPGCSRAIQPAPTSWCSAGMVIPPFGPGIGSIQHAVLDHAHGPVAVVPCGKDAIEAIRAEPHGIPRPHL